jgi:gliding motility-associated-like protein
LAYSATTASPDEYSIDFDATAEGEGFVDVVNAALPASPITVTVPGGATPGVYNGVLTVRNSTTGCVSSTTNITITINPNPTITLVDADVEVCSGEVSVDLSYSATTGTPDQYSIDFDATAEGEGFVDVAATALPASPIVITVPGGASDGTYSALLTVLSGTTGCMSSVPITITISPASTATLTGDNTICMGESTDLTITLTGVAPWDVVYTDGISNFNIDNILTSPHVFSVTPGITTTYNLVSVIDQCAVAGTVNGTATITVQPVAPPSDADISGDATICSGESTDLIVTVTGGATPFEVTLSDGANPIIINAYTSGDPIPVSPTTTTVYTITSVIDANGCNALNLTGPATVTVNPTPVSAVLGGSTNICTGGSADLSVVITDGTGPFSFTVDNGVGVISNYTSGDPIPISPGATTTYNIVGDVTDSNGCSVAGSGSATITISTGPTADLTGTASICDGETTDLTVMLTGVGPWEVVYTDGTTDFTISNVLSSPLIIPVSPTATTTYDLVSVDDTCGPGTVSGTATVTLRDVNDPICTGTGVGCFAFTIIVVDAQTQRPSCSNQNDGVITLDVSGTTPGNYIIQLISSSATLTQVGPSGVYSFTGLSPDTYEYRITDASSNVCQLPYNLPLETSIVASAADFVDVLCFGTATGQATFTVISGGNSPFEYSVDGIIWHSFFSGEPVSNLPPNGTYPVLIRDGATDLCPFVVSVTINNINPQITIGLDTEDASCGNNDGSILIVTPPAGGTGGPYTFRLDGIDASPVNDAFVNLYGGNHIVTVTDNSGCGQDFIVFVPYPDFIEIAGINSTDASCNGPGSIGILIDNFIANAQYEIAYSTSIAEEPTQFSTQYYLGNGLVLITGLPRGNYFVWIKTSSSQCATLVNNILLNEPIELGGPIPISFEFGCRYANGDLQLTNISGAPTLDYQYEVFANGFLVQGSVTPDPSGSAVISGFASGPYIVNLIQDQSSVGGCPTQETGFQNAPFAALDTVFVRVPPPADKLELSFPEKGTASRVVRIQESGQPEYEIRLELIQPFGESDPNPLRDWAIVNNQETRFNNLYAGVYTLSLRDGYGCVKNYEITIDMFTGIWIPNIFTPNNDGFNDFFFIRNLPVSGGAKLIVSNRWGKQVFTSNNYQNEWDGGNESDGVYYYRLQVAGDTFTGWVEIMRGAKP